MFAYIFTFDAHQGKHAQKYVLHNAIRQCASYMLVHMFYWLVTRSKLVESVYGVAVAGVNCKDMARKKSFAVVLMRMSLPANIGGKLRIKKYEISGTSGALADLWAFATVVCRKNPGASPDLGVGRGRPSCLQMPFELLQSEPSGWSMVENGTANLVLRIHEDRGWVAIGEFFQYRALTRLTARLDRGGKKRSYPIYFKSKNFLATDDPKNAGFYDNVIDVKVDSVMDIRDVYFMQPWQTSSGIYILMVDIGVPFRTITSFQGGLQSFATAFIVFMKRVLDCQNDSGLVHGDIHMGNLLIDENQRLRLIDYDEARYDELTVRRPPNGSPKICVQRKACKRLCTIHQKSVDAAFLGMLENPADIFW